MKKNNKGFSLLEVMITLVIIAVGMLGVAGMSLKASLLSVENAQKNEALYLANDIVNRMRANIDNAASYASSPVGDIATQDLASWNNSISEKLVTGKGCIYYDNGRVLVAVAWQSDAALGDAIESIQERYESSTAKSMVGRANACGEGEYGTEEQYRQAVVVNTFIG